MEDGGSQTLRLAGRARLSRGGREVGDWFCESCTAKHCLDGLVDVSEPRLLGESISIESLGLCGQRHQQLTYMI